MGEIIDGEMVFNEYGQVVADKWLKTGEIRTNVQLDRFILMPNHIHGIIFICRGILRYAPTKDAPTPSRSPSRTIGAIVRGFKSTAAKKINQIRNVPGAPVWQRNYYEHIIRNEKELNNIREYIVNNPLKWELDRENPSSTNYSLDHKKYFKDIYEWTSRDER